MVAPAQPTQPTHESRCRVVSPCNTSVDRNTSVSLHLVWKIVENFFRSVVLVGRSQSESAVTAQVTVPGAGRIKRTYNPPPGCLTPIWKRDFPERVFACITYRCRLLRLHHVLLTTCTSAPRASSRRPFPPARPSQPHLASSVVACANCDVRQSPVPAERCVVPVATE